MACPAGWVQPMITIKKKNEGGDQPRSSAYITHASQVFQDVGEIVLSLLIAAVVGFEEVSPHVPTSYPVPLRPHEPTSEKRRI